MKRTDLPCKTEEEVVGNCPNFLSFHGQTLPKQTYFVMAKVCKTKFTLFHRKKETQELLSIYLTKIHTYIKILLKMTPGMKCFYKFEVYQLCRRFLTFLPSVHAKIIHSVKIQNSKFEL